MQDGGCVLQLTGLADDGGFAVALCLAGLNAQSFDTFLPQQRAQLFTDGDQLVQIFAVTTGIGIGDHGHGQGAARGGRNRAPHLLVNFIHLQNDFSNLSGHR